MSLPRPNPGAARFIAKRAAFAARAVACASVVAASVAAQAPSVGTVVADPAVLGRVSFDKVNYFEREEL